MSGPFGDISNSNRVNDMPLCTSTYVVYTFNYARGTGEAFENWGHQMEAQLEAVDIDDIFRSKFQGPNYPQTEGVIGRCGDVHNPPNARFEYDRGNPNPQSSDCLDWNPDSLGTLSEISCKNWGCDQISDSDNPPLNYMIWNWQNLPGINNPKEYQGKQLRNWWDIYGDFDGTMANSRRLTLPDVVAPKIERNQGISAWILAADKDGFVHTQLSISKTKQAGTGLFMCYDSPQDGKLCGGISSSPDDLFSVQGSLKSAHLSAVDLPVCKIEDLSDKSECDVPLKIVNVKADWRGADKIVKTNSKDECTAGDTFRLVVHSISIGRNATFTVNIDDQTILSDENSEAKMFKFKEIQKRFGEPVLGNDCF
jgi:hypothetical protein